MATMSVRVRQARNGARLSQARLALQVGVRRSAVAQWEAAEGGTSPSVAHLCQLASITGVCFEWLATGRGPMRVAGTETVDAALVGDFARDEIENRALDLLRRLPQRNRVVACRLLAALAP